MIRSPQTRPPGTLRAYRLLSGLSREALAELAHVHPDTVRRLELARSSGTPESRAAIAAALDADPDVLFRRGTDGRR
jgi:transcriptional regulator with XRE-family HTH domain